MGQHLTTIEDETQIQMPPRGEGYLHPYRSRRLVAKGQTRSGQSDCQCVGMQPAPHRQGPASTQPRRHIQFTLQSQIVLRAVQVPLDVECPHLVADEMRRQPMVLKFGVDDKIDGIRSDTEDLKCLQFGPHMRVVHVPMQLHSSLKNPRKPFVGEPRQADAIDASDNIKSPR